MRFAFIDAWNQYASETLARPEGVRAGCEPMRFPARGASYRGVAVVWHGFSSCPQAPHGLEP